MSYKLRNANSDQDNAGFDAGSSGIASFFDAINQAPAFASPSVPGAQPAPSVADFAPPSFEILSAASGTSGTSATSATITSSTTTTTKTTATSSAASWINTLQTTAMATDMAAADVTGTVTYAGLDKLFTDLDAVLSSTNSKLAAAELADLKTIAANLNNGMSTSAYLVGITQALVNGNAANATWTGGSARR